MNRRSFLIAAPACISGIAGLSLTAATAQAGSPLRGSVAIGNVTGNGAVPSTAFLADLTPRRFRSVLQSTLEGAHLASDGAARYRLDAHVEHVDYPSASFIPLAVTVRAIVQYSLIDLATGAVVLSTRADESAMVTRLQVPDEMTRANTAIRKCALGNAQRLITTLNDPGRLAAR